MHGHVYSTRAIFRMTVPSALTVNRNRTESSRATLSTSDGSATANAIVIASMNPGMSPWRIMTCDPLGVTDRTTPVAVWVAVERAAAGAVRSGETGSGADGVSGTSGVPQPMRRAKTPEASTRTTMRTTEDEEWRIENGG